MGSKITLKFTFMEISLNFALNQEEMDALQDRVDLYNSGSGLPAITPSKFIETVEVGPYIQGLVMRRYETSLNRLGSAASALPYESRQALIAEIESQIP